MEASRRKCARKPVQGWSAASSGRWARRDRGVDDDLGRSAAPDVRRKGLEMAADVCLRKGVTGQPRYSKEKAFRPRSSRLATNLQKFEVCRVGG